MLLAQNDGAYLTTQSIAAYYGMSSKMLASVLPALCDAGLLTSRAGWHGGFTLALAPSEISVAAIVRATVGERIFTDVNANAADGSPGALIDAFWRGLDTYVQQKLSTTTAAHLLAEGA
jgi:Rrf2 family protein